MNSKTILDVFGFQRRYLSALIDDIPDDRMTAQPGGVVNHPAWHLGHLAYVSDRFATMLGQPPTLEAWKERFSPGTTPGPDRAAYPAKAELLRALDGRRDALAAAFARATPEDLAKPNPVAAIAPFHPTVGHMILFGMTCHEATHLGQLATWRKAMGMTEALAKLRRQ
jgi:hypothetical protein